MNAWLLVGWAFLIIVIVLIVLLAVDQSRSASFRTLPSPPDTFDLPFRVAAVSVMREVADVLPDILVQLAYMDRRFQHVEYFVYENDSKDETVGLLKAWEASKPHNIHITTESLGKKPTTAKGKHSASRFQRMAEIRQQYVDWLQPRLDEFDYVFVFEGDVHDLNLSEALQVFSDTERWDATFPNGIEQIFFVRKYYDPIAFADHLGRRVHGHDGGSTGTIPVPSFKKEGDWVPVRSAFAGAGFYRAELFKDASYLPEENQEPDCEHVIFHERMPQARMFVVPQWELMR